ncbi:MAG: hypothetical protein JNL80_17425 [Phycisphaerae bacterium]|nr:hypothetical protein [Phycisphaerae bacterium]
MLLAFGLITLFDGWVPRDPQRIGWEGQPSDFQWWGGLLLFGLTMGPMILAAFLLDRSSRRSRVRRADAWTRCLLSVRRCPSCGSRLACDSPRRPDTLTTCPCGAAWQRERVGTIDIGSSSTGLYEMASLVRSVATGVRPGVGEAVADGRGVQRKGIRPNLMAPPARRETRRILAEIPAWTAIAVLLGAFGVPIGSALVALILDQKPRMGADAAPIALPLLAVAAFAFVRGVRRANRLRIRLRGCPVCGWRLKRVRPSSGKDSLGCPCCGGVWDIPQRPPRNRSRRLTPRRALREWQSG